MARPKLAPSAPKTSLNAALDDALRGRWRGLRSQGSLYAQAKTSVRILETAGCHFVEDVTKTHLARIVSASLENDIAPSTVRKRLNCLSALGVDLGGFTYRVPSPRKWFLRAEDELRLAKWWGANPELMVVVHWTCATGLRIEETLRLRWRDISVPTDEAEGVWLVNVPGTKTADAQGTLPLSVEAAAILSSLKPLEHSPAAQVFTIGYRQLRLEWNKCREYLGLEDVPTATLKALRRSFARRAHLKGMPIDLLRQYLRHRQLSTTQGYLHLIGGYNQDEMRRYL